MPKGRRVRRVVRKFDTWTVLKVSFLFNLCMFVVFLTAGIILYKGAEAAGAVALAERAIKSNLQLEAFTINGRSLFTGAALMGLVIAALVTFLTCITALLYNLISDLIGGIQVWVLEEVLPEPAYGPEEYNDYDDDEYNDYDDGTYVEEDGFGPDTDEHRFLGRRRKREEPKDPGATAPDAGAYAALDNDLYDRQADPTPAPGWPAYGQGDVEVNQASAAGAYGGAVDPSGGAGLLSSGSAGTEWEGDVSYDGATDHAASEFQDRQEAGSAEQYSDNLDPDGGADSMPTTLTASEIPPGLDAASQAPQPNEVIQAPSPTGKPFIGAPMAGQTTPDLATTAPGGVPAPLNPPVGEEQQGPAGLFSRWSRRLGVAEHSEPSSEQPEVEDDDTMRASAQRWSKR